MNDPTQKLAESIGHQCQNGHGVLADVVMTQLATGETDILCQPCLIMLMSAAITAMLQNTPESEMQGDDPAALAMKAAAEALAANPAT